MGSGVVFFFVVFFFVFLSGQLSSMPISSMYLCVRVGEAFIRFISKPHEGRVIIRRGGGGALVRARFG